MQSPTLVGSTVAAGSTAATREQCVRRKLDGPIEPDINPTDDEADDSILDDVAHEGKS
jgi:hypothetical protein